MTRHVLIETNDSEDDIEGSDYQSDAMICMPGYPCNTPSISIMYAWIPMS